MSTFVFDLPIVIDFWRPSRFLHGDQAYAAFYSAHLPAALRLLKKLRSLCCAIKRTRGRRRAARVRDVHKLRSRLRQLGPYDIIAPRNWPKL